MHIHDGFVVSILREIIFNLIIFTTSYISEVINCAHSVFDIIMQGVSKAPQY